MMYRVWQDRKSDKGFTLTELLVVIAILGILAAVVVFAVGGINDKGKDSACKTEKQTLQTAEEAYYAKHNSYTDVAGLKADNFLKDDPGYYTADTAGTITAKAGSGCS
jgi:prepilin-type N-terminal cleavage/methylation domain-containing protein